MPTVARHRGGSTPSVPSRGLRDVWLAQGAGRIEGVRAGRTVESWFFPAPGDEPYAFVHVRDEPASARDLKALGIGVSGTRVTVPLSAARLPPAGRLRALMSQLVQLRPILEDPARAVYLEQLMGAFLEPEIFDGAVTLTRPHRTPRAAQLRLVEEQPDN